MFPLQGAQVRSLVGKLGFYIQCGVAYTHTYMHILERREVNLFTVTRKSPAHHQLVVCGDTANKAAS